MSSPRKHTSGVEHLASPRASLKHASDEQSQEARAGFVAQVSSVLFYLLVSTMMSFINKWALQLFPLPTTLLLLQMTAAGIIVMLLSAAGVVKFDLWSRYRCWQLMSITVFYVANTALSLGGLAKINIPIYTTLKRLTPICVLLLKLVMNRRAPPWRVSASVLMVVFGCVIAGAGDLAFDLTGYLYSVGSCVMQAAYLVLVETQGAKGIPASEMLWYNAVSSLPLLLAASCASGEGMVIRSSFAAAASRHGTLTTLLAIVLCSTGGIILNFSMFLATVVGSALFMTLVGNIKTVLILALGFVLLGGAKLTLLMALGIAVNLMGGVWYGSLKFKPPPLRAEEETVPLLGSAPSVGSGAQVHINVGHHRPPSAASA